MRRTVIILLVLLLGAASARAQDEGAALFKANCARCHNANGDGKTAAGDKMKIPDLRSSEIQKMSDEELYQTIGNGARHKRYPHIYLSKGIPPAQIRQLVTYIRSLRTKH